MKSLLVYRHCLAMKRLMLDRAKMEKKSGGWKRLKFVREALEYRAAAAVHNF